MRPNRRNARLLAVAGVIILFGMMLFLVRAASSRRAEREVQNLVRVGTMGPDGGADAEGTLPSRETLAAVLRGSGVVWLRVRDSDGRTLVDTGSELQGTATRTLSVLTAKGLPPLTVIYQYVVCKDSEARFLITTVGAILLAWAAILYLLSLKRHIFLTAGLSEQIRKIDGHAVQESARSVISLLHTLDTQITLLIKEKERVLAEKERLSTQVHAALDSLRPHLMAMEEASQAIGKELQETNASARAGDEISLDSQSAAAERWRTMYEENVDLLKGACAAYRSLADQRFRLEDSTVSSYQDVEGMLELAKNMAYMASEARSGVEDSNRSLTAHSNLLKDLEDRATESAGLSAETTARISKEGMMSVVTGAEGMQRIEDGVTSLTRTIEKLGDRSRDIQKILSVIREVTDQTRLLSLNAHILAVQAGESGKGFTVVADEMQDLSEKTSQSARGIAEIVGTIIREIQAATHGASQLGQVVVSGT